MCTCVWVYGWVCGCVGVCVVCGWVGVGGVKGGMWSDSSSHLIYVHIYIHGVGRQDAI